MEEINKLSEVISIHNLQQLQDTFADMAHVTLVVVAPNGRPITRPSNLGGLCKLVQQTETGAALCRRTNELLCEKNRITEEPAISTCPHSGLVTAAVPIFIEREYVASWIIGQARVGDAADTMLVQAAEHLGIEESELRGGLEQLPRLSLEEFQHIFQFLKILNRLLLRLSSAGTEMARQNKELRHITIQYERSAEMLRSFIDASDAGMFVTDFETGEVLMMNQRFRNAVGLSGENHTAQKCWEVAGPPGSTGFCSHCPRMALLDAEGKPDRPITWERYVANVDKWIRATSQAVFWADERLAHMVTYLDVTAEHAMRDELAKLAFYDNQMGLPNGLKLQQDLREENSQYDGYLVCFDVGALRRVNNAYDRATGDLLLKTIVDWVNRQGFEMEMMYRIEGDAFALYVPKEPADEAQRVAQAVFKRFKKAWVLPRDSQEITVMCRVSVAVINLREEFSYVDILSVIERMLDESRKQGDVVEHNEEMDRVNREHVRLEMSLKRCVQGDMQGFEVYFQPIVEPSSGVWKGLEALCRWTDPETQCMVPPNIFIKEAEQMGLIREIGLFVLDSAVGTCKKFGLDKVNNFFISVNLSPDQVMDANFVDHVKGILLRQNYPGKKLVFEVTESTEFSFNSYTIRAIDSLRLWGVRFSLDDFGTGYSSFNNLKNLPVSTLKTEREFIQDIENDTYMQYFFYSVAELAHAADMRLIAEGVETEQQLALLLMNGADYVQGYYFAKPMPAKQLGENVSKFYHADPSFYQLNNARMVQHIFSGKNAYLLSPGLFRATNESVRVLLEHVDLHQSFDEVLKIVGKHLDVSRGYIFLEQDDQLYSNTHEWCADGVACRKDKFQNVDLDKACPSWLPVLNADHMIVTADIALLPEDIRSILLPVGIKALAVLPISDDVKTVGFMGFEDTNVREWIPEEIAMIRNLCMIISGSLKRKRLTEQLHQADSLFSDILNNMGIAIMVTDPFSHEILWENKSVRSMYSLSNSMLGNKCHQILHGRSAPCKGCKVEYLLKNPDVKQNTWELHNKKTGRHYLLNDSLVRREADNRIMHLQYALDVTDIKQVKNKLYSSGGSAAETMNRNSLIIALQNHIQQTVTSGETLSIVLINITSLKDANDIYGHDAGDELIMQTVKALRSVMSPSDLMGRYSGDEFIILMPGKNRSQATELAERARETMRKNQSLPLGEKFIFTYGVVENSELPDGDPEQAMSVVVDLIDNHT